MAGWNSSTACVLGTLAQLGGPFRYISADISASMAGSAMGIVVLDVAQPAPDDLRGAFDAVFALNCVHATEDPARSTGHVRKMLRPGGSLALIELMPRLYFFHMVFGFVEGWWMFNDGGLHAMAGLDFWEESLIRAGFDGVAWLDERIGPDEQVGRIDHRVIVVFAKQCSADSNWLSG